MHKTILLAATLLWAGVGTVGCASGQESVQEASSAVEPQAVAQPGPEAATGTDSSPASHLDSNTNANTEPPGIAVWGRVLEQAQADGGLRYASLKKDGGDLKAFLATLPGADPSSMNREEALAFWINAYNGLVAQGVVQRYPEIESVIKVEGFFDQERHTIAGEELTLNEIERRGLDLDEPRVHFAVVCASTGCPDLRDEPFRAEDMERQLREQTAAFLADESKGLRYDEAANELWLSSIFDWYSKDFGGDALAWILPLLPEELTEKLSEKLQTTPPTLRYIDYDWSPNDRSSG